MKVEERKAQIVWRKRYRSEKWVSEACIDYCKMNNFLKLMGRTKYISYLVR